jgi:hypothetical protein
MNQKRPKEAALNDRIVAIVVHCCLGYYVPEYRIN